MLMAPHVRIRCPASTRPDKHSECRGVVQGTHHERVVELRVRHQDVRAVLAYLAKHYRQHQHHQEADELEAKHMVHFFLRGLEQPQRQTEVQSSLPPQPLDSLGTALPTSLRIRAPRQTGLMSLES